VSTESGAPDAPAEAGDDATGACTATDTVANCGACGRSCDANHSLGAACQAGACTYAGCSFGWGDCNAAAPDTDGCETALTTPTNCGACGQACDTARSLGATCAGGACGYAGCAPGWADCTKAAPDTDGCETSTSSPSNCGGCGQACDTSTGQPTCNGTACTYQCAPGRTDCNAGRAPNTDGCECATPGCCAGGCQTTHTNGVGQSFFDCAPRAAYSQTQATEACVAFTGDPNSCSVPVSLCGMPATQAICSAASTAQGTCYCWEYAGPLPGKVAAGTGLCAIAIPALCPSTSDRTWN